MLIEHQAITEYFSDSAFLADGLFSDLSPAAGKSLETITRTKELAAGDAIFTAGQKPCCLYFLIEGEAQIFYAGTKPVRRVNRSEILGLTEALSGLPYEMTARAVTHCRFRAIRREDFIDFLQNNPEICFKLLQMLGTNLQKLFRLFH